MLRRQLSHAAFGWMDAEQQFIEGESAADGDYNFAVENELPRSQTEQRLNQVRKIACQRPPGLGLQLDLAVVSKGQTPKTIPFGLVLPTFARLDVIDRPRLHRRSARF